VTIKKAVSSIIHVTARMSAIRALVSHPVIRDRVQTWPGFRRIYGNGWEFQHPIDSHYRTETSGFVPPNQLASSPLDSARGTFYAGSQPSIIRRALNTLPELPECTFIDLGCGRGRPLLVASEFPFRSLIGVELSSSLVLAARKNAARLGQSYAQRPPIVIEQGDAAQFPIPPGNAVVFLYNPFGEEVIVRVVSRIEEAVAAGGRTIFVIYYNPVHGHAIDASPALNRYFAANVPYSSEELGYGPDIMDSIVIWQGGAPAHAHPHANADAKIKITVPGVRAELA
jgi:SAM-dependent methyltransferase